MNIIEAMKQRRSVRTYAERPLTDSERAGLEEAIKAAESPFKGNVTIHLKSFDIKEGFKPSTYGMIKGASDFFLIGYNDDPETALSVGFRFEQVVLRAWQMGLGTCWIAATFKGTDFAKGASWPSGESLKIISPVGTPASQSFMEKISRFAVGSNNRKPFDKLFFDNDFQTPYNPAGRFGEALEMLRLAPSSTNSQPWRALVCDNIVHFYYVPKSSLSVLDCGIALCHFNETEKFNGKTGTFQKLSDAPTPPQNLKYLISYKPNS